MRKLSDDQVLNAFRLNGLHSDVFNIVPVYCIVQSRLQLFKKNEIIFNTIFVMTMEHLHGRK